MPKTRLWFSDLWFFGAWVRGPVTLPLLLAALAIGGLILGLTGDGWRDWAAVILLCAPIIPIAHRGLKGFSAHK